MRLLGMLTLAVALAAPSLLGGCGSRAQSSTKPPIGADFQPPATVPQTATAPAEALTCAAPTGPKVGEADSDGYEIIWTRPQQKPVAGSCHAAFDEFYATRIGLTLDSLAVDLKFEAVRPDDPESPWRGKTIEPTLTVLQDGCPAKAPQLLGQLSYGGPESRMVLRRLQLPIGDLELIFGAFGRQHTVLVHNDGRTLRTIVEEEMKNYVVIPGDPSKGEERSAGYMQPDCSKHPGAAALPGGSR